MTAEEYANENMQYVDESVIDAFQRFAQLKCKKLLDIVAEKAEVKTVTIPSGLNIKTCVVDTDSILNCVNLENFCK